MHQFDAQDESDARAWLAAAARPSVSERLEAIYGMIADQVSAHVPVCVASGRCCNFESYGHRLYVTGLEAAWCIQQLGPEHPELSPAAVADAVRRGGCPFQIGTLCGVHAIKPVGCRTYFCDPRAEGWKEALTERAHGMVKDLHEASSIPYRYMEWRAMLSLFAGLSPRTSAHR